MKYFNDVTRLFLEGQISLSLLHVNTEVVTVPYGWRVNIGGRYF